MTDLEGGRNVASPITVTEVFTPLELVAIFTEVSDRLALAEDDAAVLNGLAELATQRVPGAEFAGVTVGREGQKFVTAAATDELVRRIDEIQYGLVSGPSVDAIQAGTTVNAADLRTDARWAEFGRRAVELNILSMLSLRVYAEADDRLSAGLNLYSHAANAFDEVSETMAGLLASIGALAVGRASAQDRSRNLSVALQSSREIGIAMGIVMAQAKVSRDQAFDLLRVVSQRTHRKLSELASEIADTGILPNVPVPPVAKARVR